VQESSTEGQNLNVPCVSALLNHLVPWHPEKAGQQGQMEPVQGQEAQTQWPLQVEMKEQQLQSGLK